MNDALRDLRPRPGLSRGGVRHGLRRACEIVTLPLAARRQGGILRMQKGYDHSYFFVSTFMEDHIGFHAAALYD